MKKSTISKLFDGISNAIGCCLLSKRIVSESNSSQFEDRNRIDLLTSVWAYFWRQSLVLPLMIAAIAMTGYTTTAQNILGQAPVLVPKGGFAIDGNAFAKFPGDNPLWGDFLFEMGETNPAADPGGIFVPIPPPYDYPDGPLPSNFYITPGLTTFFRDNITNNDPTIFTSSNKINDNPTTYTWGAGSSPNKNEIQNAIAHFSYGDPAIGGIANELWMIFAADRQVTEGSSYIDFEILQKSLTINKLGTDAKGFDYGNFLTEGTDNGRTIGDVLVTIEFTQGGVFANVVTKRWNGTSYIDFNPDFGTIFGTNNTNETVVPYPIYNQDPIASGPNAGMWAYSKNQWAEGAVNVTRLFPGSTEDPCFVISTLFVRTRTSGSSGQSELKDFPGIPLQLNLCTDKTPPVIAGIPGPSTIDCPATPVFATATATDNCELESLVFADVTTPGNCPGNYSVTRTWTATDSCGNTSTASQTINVQDVTPPVIICPTVTSPIDCPATPSFGVATATDSCDPSVDITFADVTTPGNCAGNYSVTRTWTATDDCGNTASCSRTIVVRDITAPVITCPTVTSPIDCSATPSFGVATATDSCDPSVDITFADVTTPGNCAGNYSVTRTWTATDDCGNSASCSRTIVVQDTTAPVITCPTVTSPIDCPATPSFGVATATDSCDPSVDITFADVTTPGNCPGSYSVTRTWTATDDCGNTSTCSRTIVVQDITAPVITCPTVISPIDCPATPSFGVATATDSCDPSVDITFADVTTPGNCPANYSVTRTWTATDDCGNTASCSRTIVVQDITAPVITCVADKTIECDAEVVFDAPTATDNCDANPLIEIVSTSPDGLTRTWKATDACGNVSATCSQTITVESCPVALCTYTQGYYGNAGGKSCAPDDGGIFGQYTTAELIAKALASYGGTMTIGLPGHSVWIANNMTDINALISVMPGGGGSYVLSAGNFEINNLPSSYLKNGRINNTLLAQTIALGLNIGINGALGDFELKAGMLTTAASEGGCGSDVPVARTCNPDGSVNNEYQRYEIKAKVVNALSVKTVQGLFELANQALGGGSTNGLSLSEIASAVDKINNAFDGCRIFIGYDVPKLVCPILTTTTKIVNDDLAGFTASPVPFTDQLTIKYDFDYQSDVKIEVFNAQGSKVLSKADTNSYLNKEVTLDLNVNKGQEQVYVVKLTTDRGSSTKKVMSSR